MIVVKYLVAFNHYFVGEIFQKSSKRDYTLKVNNGPTKIDNERIQFHYTENDYAHIIRAYIDTVTSN